MNLALFAHPDDETLACGGLIARAPGDWHVAVLADGVTARGRLESSPGAAKRVTHFHAAMDVLGVDKVRRELHGLPDQRLDKLDFLDLTKGVAQIIDRVQPTAVYTHWRGDLNRDHWITCEAVHVACRPPGGPNLYECEVASSTEWGMGESFRPNVFIPLTEKQAGKKADALMCYIDEVRDFPHPRSYDGVFRRLQYWGQVCGHRYAEPFTLVREVR